MITDLTPTQTISIGIAIALATLIFLTILTTIAYIEEIRNFLTRTGILLPRAPQTDFRTAPFPQHYVDPYTNEPRRTVGWSCMTTTNTSHHRCSVQITTSDKYVTRRTISELTMGIWRSPEPTTEDQQPILGPSRLQPAR